MDYFKGVGLTFCMFFDFQLIKKNDWALWLFIVLL